jgi:two-component system cell cycle response regulator
MSGRVLVVDDVAANVKLLEAKLSSEYFDVLTAYNGPNALEIAETELPDVILLDVMMPRMDGFEVCRQLKANRRTVDVPVVMVTALSDTANRLRGLEAGADDFLTKPVNDVALFARVRSLVRLKRMMEELRVREGICSKFGGGDTPVSEDTGPARIMIVDDDEFAVARMTETLLPIANSVARASTCTEAWMLLAPDIELIIASLSTPGGDALRLVTQCRANETSRQLPILLIADDTDLPRLAKGLDLGANDYLVRPVDRNELLARTATQVRRKRLQNRLDENYRNSLELALTDELTGLYHRRYLFVHLDELIQRVNQDGINAAVLLFDIDNFKQVNDTYGHAAGDDVLRELAARTTHCVRSVDLVARRGDGAGDEFVVVMPEIDITIAAGVAERLRAEVAREPFTIKSDGRKLSVTISIGVAAAATGSDDRDRLLSRADDALYAAKTRGRNCVIVRPPAVAASKIGSSRTEDAGLAIQS